MHVSYKSSGEWSVNLDPALFVNMPMICTSYFGLVNETLKENKNQSHNPSFGWRHNQWPIIGLKCYLVSKRTSIENYIDCIFLNVWKLKMDDVT